MDYINIRTPLNTELKRIAPNFQTMCIWDKKKDKQELSFKWYIKE